VGTGPGGEHCGEHDVKIAPALAVLAQRQDTQMSEASYLKAVIQVREVGPNDSWALAEEI
jgi:hypothetical protein